jgi:hypothetical protein
MTVYQRLDPLPCHRVTTNIKRKQKTREIMATIVAFCVVFSPTLYLHPRLSTSRILWPAKALCSLYNVHFLLVTASMVRERICKRMALTVSK